MTAFTDFQLEKRNEKQKCFRWYYQYNWHNEVTFKWSFSFIARCPVGTYYDRPADDCLLCPEGSYSPREGALVCERCPEGTWTLGTRKENFTACTGNCFGFDFWHLFEWFFVFCLMFIWLGFISAAFSSLVYFPEQRLVIELRVAS